MENDTPIEVRIMQIYEDLPAGERRLAEVILEMDGNFSGFTAGELAGRAGVSNPTAARFFRRLSYDNYQQAHNQARERASQGSPLTALRKKSRRGTVTFDFGLYADQEIRNLNRTSAEITGEQLESAVSLIRSARRIWIVGFRNSMTVGLYLHAILNLLRDGVTILPRAGMTLAEELVNMRNDDLIILVAFRRRPAIAARIIRTAQKRGTRILQLADLGVPSQSDGSILTLRCSMEGAGIFDSYAAAVTLVNCLGSLLEQSVGSAAANRLTQIENLLDEVDAINRGP